MKKVLIIAVLMVVALIQSNCSKSDDMETIELLGQENYVLPINDFIPDSLQSKIEVQVDTMPKGYIPCSIEGEYVISPTKFCYSNFIDLNDTQEIHFRVTNQHNRTAHVELHEGSTVVTDTAYIMGNGQNFTLYFKEKRTRSFFGQNESVLDRSVIITGEKTEAGIKDLMFTTIILAAEQGDNPLVGTFRPGWYFIYKDRDGLSENCDWFDNN